MKKLTFVLVLLFTTSTYAIEPRNSYIGFHLGEADVDDVDLDYYLIRMGVEVDDHIDLELRYGRGSNEQDYGGIDFEIESIGGLYGLYHVGILYGIAGWSSGTVKASLMGQNIQIEEDSFSYGVGLEFLGFNVEWMQYIDTSDIEADAVSIGYSYYFE